MSIVRLRCRIKFLPVDQEIYITPGTTVKDAINLAKFDFDFPCGGRGKCGKCRLRIAEGAVAPAKTDTEHLDPVEIAQGYRLACVTQINNDMVIEIPYVKSPQYKILIAAVQKQVKLGQHLSKIYLELDPPKLEDQQPDWERLLAEFDKTGLASEDKPASLSLLRDLPQTLRQADWHVTALTDEETVFGLEPGDSTKTMLGIAFDIGTTTIVGYLLDLLTGREMSVVSALNPQTRYGADVIARIAYATSQEDGLDKLHDAIISALNELIDEAVSQAKVSREDVYAVTVVGNTCMHHLFLGISPKNLALAPYVPVVSQPLAFFARELGLKINRLGRVYVLPNIAGFVGADTVGVLLATELDWSEGFKLAIDIGTNGEIVLGSKERLVACSTAAGPAFEGSQISSGMRGMLGAIDHVRFRNGLEISVIGGGKPCGICGSGLLDTVAGLLEQGIVDRRGRILSPDELDPIAIQYSGNIIKLENGAKAFELAAAQETAHGRPILITQKDISELQLAKGAIAAGIQVLCEQLGIGLEAITEVLLAGAFGNYLDLRSACAIGMIPAALEARLKPVGNAAGAGAKAALLSRSEYQRAAMIADFVEYVELSIYPNFSRLFVSSLDFPSRRI